MKIVRIGNFERMLEELGKEDKLVFELARERIKLLRKNPQDTRLKVHPLKRRMKGKWAFSVDEDVRVVFEWLGKRTVRFLAIGKHGKVYGRN
jgi:mRNA-degrading endonuclease YafQ of YafQ-DinJ toxin-antitoxin module